jgi:hypothetical protein
LNNIYPIQAAVKMVEIDGRQWTEVPSFWLKHTCDTKGVNTTYVSDCPLPGFTQYPDPTFYEEKG